MNVLPKEGDFITLKLMRKLRETLSFTDNEIDTIGFKYEWKCPKCGSGELSLIMPKCSPCGTWMKSSGTVSWDEAKARDMVKDIHLGDSMFALCVNTLKKLSDTKKLTEQHMSLYEKFIVADEGE